ncbi:hypothetical protein BLNAU_22597 [Blattamonas nauphoetae]|uniref:Uncharacterized protein n=1 Tax=Blattamonas nauphoetae TaxID=2049346 RepID=A0ABQ9WSK9_9EUKA|nr:hypothetical protein BLNAU_22597 [Blattamonas nauphoetae]
MSSELEERINESLSSEGSQFSLIILELWEHMNDDEYLSALTSVKCISHLAKALQYGSLVELKGILCVLNQIAISDLDAISSMATQEMFDGFSAILEAPEFRPAYFYVLYLTLSIVSTEQGKELFSTHALYDSIIPLFCIPPTDESQEYFSLIVSVDLVDYFTFSEEVIEQYYPVPYEEDDSRFEMTDEERAELSGRPTTPSVHSMNQTTLSQSPPPDSPNDHAQIRTGITFDESEPEDDDQGRNEAEPITREEEGEGKGEQEDDNETKQEEEEETIRDEEDRKEGKGRKKDKRKHRKQQEDDESRLEDENRRREAERLAREENERQEEENRKEQERKDRQQREEEEFRLEEEKRHREEEERKAREEARVQAEAEARKREEEEFQRQKDQEREKEEQERLRKEEDEKRRREEEKKQQEEEEARWKREEDERREEERRKEDERRRQDEEQRFIEDNRRKALEASFRHEEEQVNTQSPFRTSSRHNQHTATHSDSDSDSLFARKDTTRTPSQTVGSGQRSHQNTIQTGKILRSPYSMANTRKTMESTKKTTHRSRSSKRKEGREDESRDEKRSRSARSSHSHKHSKPPRPDSSHRRQDLSPDGSVSSPSFENGDSMVDRLNNPKSALHILSPHYLATHSHDPLTKRQKELIISICFENESQKEENKKIEATVADLRMEIEKLKQEARIANAELVAAKEELDEKQAEEERMRERDHQMKQKEKALAEERKELEKLKNENRSHRSSPLSSRTGKLSADQESKQKKESQTNAQFGMLVEDLERTSQQLHRARTEISQLVEKNEKGQREKANLKKTNSHLETQILSMQGENARLKEDSRTTRELLEEARQQKAELETEFEMVKKEKSELKEKARAFERNKVTPETGQHLVTLHNTNSALKQTIQQLEETNRDLEESNEALQEKVNELTKQQDALQKQDDIIQETILKLSTIMRQDADEKGLFEDGVLFDDDSLSSSLNSRDRKKRKRQKKAVWISKDEDIRDFQSDDLDLGDLGHAETTVLTNLLDKNLSQVVEEAQQLNEAYLETSGRKFGRSRTRSHSAQLTHSLTQPIASVLSIVSSHQALLAQICQQNSVIQTWQKQQDLLLSERDRELKEKDDTHAAIQQETLLTLREKQEKIEDINIQLQRNIVTNDQLESRVAEYRALLDQKERKVNELQRKNTDLTAEREKLNSERNVVLQNLNDTKNELSKLKEDLEERERKEEELRMQLDILRRAQKEEGKMNEFAAMRKQLDELVKQKDRTPIKSTGLDSEGTTPESVVSVESSARKSTPKRSQEQPSILTTPQQPTPTVPQAHEPPMALRQAKNELVKPYASVNASTFITLFSNAEAALRLPTNLPNPSEFHSLINQINKNTQRFPNLSQTEQDVMINILSSFFVLLLPPSLIQSFTANTFQTLDTAKLNDTIFDSPYVSQLVECQIIPVYTSLLRRSAVLLDQATAVSPFLVGSVSLLCLSLTLLVSSFTQTQKQIKLLPFIHSRSTHVLDHTSLTLIPRPSALNLFVQSAGISSLAQIVLNLTSLSDPDQFDANVIQSALSSPQSFVSALSMTRSSALAWYPAAVALTTIANLIPPKPAKILEATLPSPSLFESTFALQAASTLLNTSHTTVLSSSRKSSQLPTHSVLRLRMGSSLLAVLSLDESLHNDIKLLLSSVCSALTTKADSTVMFNVLFVLNNLLSSPRAVQLEIHEEIIKLSSKCNLQKTIETYVTSTTSLLLRGKKTKTDPFLESDAAPSETLMALCLACSILSILDTAPHTMSVSFFSAVSSLLWLSSNNLFSPSHTKDSPTTTIQIVHHFSSLPAVHSTSSQEQLKALHMALLALLFSATKDDKANELLVVETSIVPSLILSLLATEPKNDSFSTLTVELSLKILSVLVNEFSTSAIFDILTKQAQDTTYNPAFAIKQLQTQVLADRVSQERKPFWDIACMQMLLLSLQDAAKQPTTVFTPSIVTLFLTVAAGNPVDSLARTLSLFIVSRLISVLVSVTLERDDVVGDSECAVLARFLDLNSNARLLDSTKHTIVPCLLSLLKETQDSIKSAGAQSISSKSPKSQKSLNEQNILAILSFLETSLSVLITPQSLLRDNATLPLLRPTEMSSALAARYFNASPLALSSCSFPASWNEDNYVNTLGIIFDSADCVQMIATTTKSEKTDPSFMWNPTEWTSLNRKNTTNEQTYKSVICLAKQFNSSFNQPLSSPKSSRTPTKPINQPETTILTLLSLIDVLSSRVISPSTKPLIRSSSDVFNQSTTGGLSVLPERFATNTFGYPLTATVVLNQFLSLLIILFNTVTTSSYFPLFVSHLLTFQFSSLDNSPTPVSEFTHPLSSFVLLLTRILETSHRHVHKSSRMGQSNEHLLSVPIKHITEQMLLSELDEIETHRHLVLIHSVVALAVSILSLIYPSHALMLSRPQTAQTQPPSLPSSFNTQQAWRVFISPSFILPVLYFAYSQPTTPQPSSAALDPSALSSYTSSLLPFATHLTSLSILVILHSLLAESLTPKLTSIISSTTRTSKPSSLADWDLLSTVSYVLLNTVYRCPPLKAQTLQSSEQTLSSDFPLHLLLWLCPTEPSPSLLLTGMVIHCANAFHSLNKSPHLLVSSFSPSAAHFIEALQTKSSPFTPAPSITRSPTRATSTFSHPDSLPLFFSLFKKPVVEALPVSVLNSLFRTFVTLTKENPFFVENSRLDGMFTHTFPQLIFFLFHSKHFHLFKLCLKMFIGCLELESNNYVLKDLTATSSLATNAKERSKRGIDSEDVTFDPSSFNNNAEMIIALFEHLLSEIRRLADYDAAARKAASDVYSSLISTDSFGTLKQLPSNISGLSANGMLSNITVNWNTSMNGAMGSSRKRRTREEQSENTVTIELKDVIDIERNITFILTHLMSEPQIHPIYASSSLPSLIQSSLTSLLSSMHFFHHFLFSVSHPAARTVEEDLDHVPISPFNMFLLQHPLDILLGWKETPNTGYVSKAVKDKRSPVEFIPNSFIISTLNHQSKLADNYIGVLYNLSLSPSSLDTISTAPSIYESLYEYLHERSERLHVCRWVTETAASHLKPPTNANQIERIGWKTGRDEVDTRDINDAEIGVIRVLIKLISNRQGLHLAIKHGIHIVVGFCLKKVVVSSDDSSHTNSKARTNAGSIKQFLIPVCSTLFTFLLKTQHTTPLLHLNQSHRSSSSQEITPDELAFSALTDFVSFLFIHPFTDTAQKCLSMLNSRSSRYKLDKESEQAEKVNSQFINSFVSLLKVWMISETDSRNEQLLIDRQHSHSLTTEMKVNHGVKRKIPSIVAFLDPRFKYASIGSSRSPQKGETPLMLLVHAVSRDDRVDPTTRTNAKDIERMFESLQRDEKKQDRQKMWEMARDDALRLQASSFSHFVPIDDDDDSDSESEASHTTHSRSPRQKYQSDSGSRTSRHSSSQSLSDSYSSLTSRSPSYSSRD